MARKQSQNENGDQTGQPAIDIRHEDDAVVVRIPVKFYRRNGRQMILAKDDASADNQQKSPATNSVLAHNLAKAWMWQEQLESGEYSTIDELAQANKVDRTYVTRILLLNSLSPTIVEQILTGNNRRANPDRQQWKLPEFEEVTSGLPILWEIQLRWQKC